LLKVPHGARAIAILLIALVACAGCGGRREPKDRLPLSLDFSSQQWSESQRKTAACMKQLGFEYFEEPLADIDQIGNYVDVPFSESAGSARVRTGYGVLARQQAVVKRATEGRNPTYVKGLNPDEQQRYRDALYGRKGSVDRCMATPLQQPEFRSKLLRREASRQRFLSDRRVLKIDRKWTACMRSKGHQEAQHMWDVVQDVVRPRIDFLSKEGSLDVELNIAQDDVACYEGSLAELEKIRLEIEDRAR
jgi:hypothetical protein